MSIYCFKFDSRTLTKALLHYLPNFSNRPLHLGTCKMATVEITNVIPASNQEQEDAWLYGDATKDPSRSTLDANATEFVSKVQNGNGEHSASESESDDDEDDDIQITIGEINKISAPQPFGMPFQPTINQPKTVSVITAPPPTITHVTAPIMVTSKRTIDVNAVGNINGVPIYDYDIDTMCEEKPWRIPGADMTDYFNYGFNEDSWKAYCDKQKGVRTIATEKNKELCIVQKVMQQDTRPLPELPKMPNNFGGMPRQMGGSIGVLGAKKETSMHQTMGTIHQPIVSIGPISHHPRIMIPGSMSLSMGMFPPALPQPAFLPMPQLAPPGLAPPMDMRGAEIKQEDGSAPIRLSAPMGGPLPPPPFPHPGMPSMLPPPGSAMAPPLLLPPPAPFSDESNSSDDEMRRRGRPRRSHSRERKRSRERRSGHHRERSSGHRRRSSRSPKKDKKSRKSSRGDENRHRHRDDDRSKRSRRKKDGEYEAETNENGNDTSEQ